MIGDQTIRHTMELVHLRKDDLGNCGRCERMAKTNEMGIFGKEVHYHQYAVEASRRRKAIDEIQRNKFPGFIRYW